MHFTGFLAAETPDQVRSTLNHLGFFHGPFDGDSSRHVDDLMRLGPDDPEFQSAVMGYQEFHGLHPDGIFGDVTKRHVLHERCCNMPDVSPSVGSDEESVRVNASRPWPKSCRTKINVAARIGDRVRGLSRDFIERSIHEALDDWESVCGVKFQRDDSLWGTGRENIRILDASLSGSTLGLAHLSTGRCSFVHMCRMDRRNWRSENLWSEVLPHELGHNLGLYHGSARSLMGPTANGSTREPQREDIERVQALYGPSLKQDPPGGDSPNPPAPGGVLWRLVESSDRRIVFESESVPRGGDEPGGMDVDF